MACTRYSALDPIPLVHPRTAAVVLAVLTLVLAAAPALAASGSMTCTPATRDMLRQHSTVDGGQATLVVPAHACPVTVSFTSYALPGGAKLPYEEQVLVDNVTGLYGPGTHHLNVDLPEDCAYQTDLYLGELLYPLKSGAHHDVYGKNRLIKFDLDEGASCDVEGTCENIDFDIDADGHALHLGQVIDDEYAGFGVDIFEESGKKLLIFDTGNPTGGDNDLRTPGNGVGNNTFLNKVLIISEDGDESDPDDDFQGGTMVFTFDEAVTVEQLGLLDVDASSMVEVRAYDVNGDQIGSAVSASSLGNNSFQTVQVGKSGVRRLEVEFNSSGALTGLVICKDDIPPPPDEVCQTVSKRCLTVELIDVATNADGTTTYNTRLTYNCRKSLWFAAYQLPDGVEAVDFTTGGPVANVYNPGFTGGYWLPWYNNILFTFNTSIRNGDSVDLSFTLPAGASYPDGLRVRTVGGWKKQSLKLNPELCEPCPDAAPPMISYSVDDVDGGGNDGGSSFVVVTVTDDTGIASVELTPVELYPGEPSPTNLELVASDFTPGALAATFRFRIVDVLRDAAIRATATDACGTVSCPDDAEPAQDGELQLIQIDDETGDFAFADPPIVAPYDRFGIDLDVADDTGIRYYEAFAPLNVQVFEQPVEGCALGERCDLPEPFPTSVNLKFATVDRTQGADFGVLYADECNAFVFDPGVPAAQGRGVTATVSSLIPAVEGVEGAASEAEVPVEFGLSPNYPNPFGASTRIEFALPEAGYARLVVYDVLGREVAVLVDGDLASGRYAVELDGRGLASGTYLYRLASDQGTAVHQMTITK